MRAFLSGIGVKYEGTDALPAQVILEQMLTHPQNTTKLITQDNVMDLLSVACVKNKFTPVIPSLVFKLNSYLCDITTSKLNAILPAYSQQLLSGLTSLLLDYSTTDYARSAVLTNLTQPIILHLFCNLELIHHVYFLSRYIDSGGLDDIVLGDYTILDGLKKHFVLTLILHVIINLKESNYATFNVSVLNEYLTINNYKDDFLRLCFINLLDLDISRNNIQDIIVLERFAWLINQLLLDSYIMPDNIKLQITTELLQKLIKYRPINVLHKINFLQFMPQLLVKLILVFIGNSQVTRYDDLKHIIKTIDKEELRAIYTILNTFQSTQQEPELLNRLAELISMFSARLDKLNQENDISGIELFELAPLQIFSYCRHYVVP